MGDGLSPGFFISPIINFGLARFMGLWYAVVNSNNLNRETARSYLSFAADNKRMMMEAILSNRDGYTVFQAGDHVIRFQAPYSLERYSRVKKWDNGYLVVDAKYSHNNGDEEEYIDLIQI